ncbi:hypothetical protein Tco_0351287 [Tanacetum coccineum]
MAEAFDEQLQQQKVQDVVLVPVNGQVKISISNLGIALEKIQPNVIFKELSTQRFYFTMGDQVIKVNEDLLRNALNITPKDLEHPFIPPAPEKEIIRCLTGKGSGYDRPRLPMLQLLWGMTVTEEIGQSEEEIVDEVDSEGTDEEEVVPLVKRRFTRVSIGKEAYRETKVVEEGIDHTKKLKGLVSLSEAAQYKLDIKKAQKSRKDSFFIQQRSKGPSEGSSVTLEVTDVQTLNCINEGVGMTSEVPDKPSDESSSSSSNSELVVEDISSDDDEFTEKANEDVEKVDTVSENSEGVKIADVEKDTNA